jgi:hypothetical protein
MEVRGMCAGEGRRNQFTKSKSLQRSRPQAWNGLVDRFLPNTIDCFFHRHLVQRRKRQSEKKPDAEIENRECIAEGSRNFKSLQAR